ncbi:MAG: hypothetical protein IT455_17520, partial [Planctomycetes bacterium]|nr:hypothetical protein [Planctomycetota bacterium]
MRHDRRLRLSLLAVAALAAALQAQGIPIGFEETWALAPDRAKVVGTLIPGTDDFYYYHCRERLDARDFATVRKVLPTWIRQHGDNQRVVEIQNRLALLGVDDAPDATFTLLRQRLGVSYNHYRVVPGARSDLPTQLDPELLSVQKLTAAALARHQGSLRGFTTRALPALASTALTAPQLRDLLGRLDRPDVDNLAELVVRDLRAEGSRGFGSLPVHGMLRLPQLEQCARQMPELLQDGKFVDAWLRRLQPDADTEWQLDPAAAVAQLERLWQFAQRLPSSFNSLKAQVLYRWLEQDLTRGAPDKQRFLAYIRLPRRGEHVAETHLRRFQDGADFVDPTRRFATALPVIGDDAPLLRACLEHFFASEDGYETYAEFLDARWLRAVLAETKLLLGQGDLARWYTLLDDPTRADTIEKRVELVFPPTMRRVYGPDDAVTLELDVKNVPQLVVKVWSIDAWRYLCEKQLPVNATIELDGVVANEERTFTYDTPPLRRVRRSFDLPSLRAPGTYVVEFVGNGISSRAVIQKGSLRLAERTAAAGQVVRVYDQDGRHRPQATAWLGGRDYAADAAGDILIPFSTAPGEKKLVLRDGAVAALVPFSHRAESYTLAASAFVPREALRAGGSARIAVRPTLRLDDHDVALSLLQEPLLTIVATDLDGVVTRQEVRDLRFVEEREYVHEIAVPERLAQLQVSLRGKVKNLAGEPVELATAETVWQLNGIDTGAATATPMLLATPDGFVLELRGKNGELLAGRTCSLQLHHRDFTDAIGVSLQTDDAGRIRLGALPGIDWLDLNYAGSSTGISTLRTAACRLPSALHGTAGQTLRLPYAGTRTTVQRDEFLLLGADLDRFEHLALVDGMLELRALPPGDYELRVLDADARIPVRITRGDADGEWLLGRHRLLERSRSSPLQLREAQLDGQGLRVQLANPGPGSRVLVFTTRYLPAADPFAALLAPAAPAPVTFSTYATESTYDSGRQLGDEYRYVLERRFAAKFAGNMLTRPSLLIHPWALEHSANDALDQSGGAGGRYGGRAGGRGGKSGGKNADLAQRDVVNPGVVANLDFLPRGATLLANLIPDAAGVVVVPPQALGDGQQVHVLALDGEQAIYRCLVRAEVALTPRSRTLQRALDSERHLTEQKRIEFVAAGGTTTLDDPRSAQVEVFDSLTSVFRLFASLSDSDDWSRFGFVTTWPQLDAKQQRELYDQHACHELNFFLYQKDRAFFDAVIRPLLACKL